MHQRWQPGALLVTFLGTIFLNTSAGFQLGLNQDSLLSFRSTEEKQRSLLNALTNAAPQGDPIEEPQSLDEDTEIALQIDIGREQLQPYFDFPLDDWQLQAGGAIVQGHNVIVAAPTGAGKTVVGEMALLHAFYDQEEMGIYTTPLKALSNQKYAELCQTFGRDDTGLSTGDISINTDARIRVMTTEVYRNIAWRSTSSFQDNELTRNAVVVLDEFHYMGLPGRGGVWEESIITSPSNTQIVGLSATLSNAPDLAAWMEHVTEKRTILIDVPPSKRPVPLRFLFATKEGLYPLFRDADAGPGAPKGLLGYRGDGTPSGGDRKKTKDRISFAESGFGRASEQAIANKPKAKLPRGLQVNPALDSAAEKRLQRVQRNLERQKVQWRVQGNQRRRGGRSWEDDEIDQYKPLPRKRMSPREERREKERLLKKEMRRAVPSLHAIVNRLQQKDLLPAIFFLFSRAGCDQAAEALYNYMKGPDTRQILKDDFDVFSDAVDKNTPTKRKHRTRKRSKKRKDLVEDGDGRTFRSGNNFISEETLSSIYSVNSAEVETGDFDETSPLSPGNWDYCAKAGLLDRAQVKEVAARISVFNKENEEIAFDDSIIEQFLFGVGSHHAGMLPAHKSFVELLYQKQLMRVVIATETLAAGINMPARTTVILSMAKRGDGGGMNLIPTASMLQMSGRAGRRGYDTDGTCVIVATPFETHRNAAEILVDEIAPIKSQFRPSYALAVNLVERGEGKLDVARQLVSKSFAMWEKNKAKANVASVGEDDVQEVDEVIRATAQENFMNELIEAIQNQIDRRRVKFDVGKLKLLVDILSDRELLKKSSKSFMGALQMLELEETTLRYLEKEKDEMAGLISPIDEDTDLLTDMLTEDETDLLNQIELQRKRSVQTMKEVDKHPFTAIAAVTNDIIAEASPRASILLSTLRTARGSGNTPDTLLEPRELCDFAKSAIVVRRKARRLAKSNPELNSKDIISQAAVADNTRDDSWDDMLSITKTLVAYGCLALPPDTNWIDSGDMENTTFKVTQAGVNLGMLAFENSLWALVAMGGTWDVVGASSRLDKFRRAMDEFEDEDWYSSGEETGSPREETQSGISLSEEEASDLTRLLRNLTPEELAGYVSTLIADSSRGGGQSVVELFQQLSASQQRVIQKSLLVMERLAEVQKDNLVDESTRGCPLDISNCEVVTKWAGGCSWSEALEISGAAPGDLARTLSRVLDAVRQFGNLPYRAIRRDDDLKDSTVASFPRGLHPDLRRMCREAAHALNRYPLKDPLSFTTGEDGDDDADDDDDNNNDATNAKDNI